MESSKRELKELNPRVVRKTARLVVRNLPFNCNEEDVRKYFSTFGQVVEVKLLRKNDDRLVGCGFVQYENKFSAANALQHTSGELFKGRPIIVDWAVPKRKYHILKCVDSDDVESNELDVKNKSDKSIVKEEITEENLPADRKPKPSENKKTKTLRSHADDDRTVFFQNVPFTVDNEQLKECAEKFAGAVEYAVICVDPLTEHSKGTAFVRFIKKKVAEKVLNNELKLVLHGKELYPLELLKKEELLDRNSKGKPLKDKRNLYLFKEGLILAGTAAARGVSQGDMNKRLILEQQRSRSLRNLHKFLSTNRLVIYNLPFYNFDNKKLLLLFKKYYSKNAVISEARVMRNLKDLDDNGLPRSKGYGFVSFKRHEDALSALRAVNNNPDVFSDKKRPIVLFSIEDKAALLLKEKRQMKVIKDKSTISKKLSSELTKLEPSKVANLNSNKIRKKQNKICKKQNEDCFRNTQQPKFVGAIAKPGRIKLPKRNKLQEQAFIHRSNLKKELIKKKVASKRESRKQRRLKKKSYHIEG